MDEESVSTREKICSLEENFKLCRGRLDGFSKELKVLFAEVDIITEWISQKFGVELINKKSFLFKHIPDYEEVEEIAATLSLLRTIAPRNLPQVLKPVEKTPVIIKPPDFPTPPSTNTPVSFRPPVATPSTSRPTKPRQRLVTAWLEEESDTNVEIESDKSPVAEIVLPVEIPPVVVPPPPPTPEPIDLEKDRPKRKSRKEIDYKELGGCVDVEVPGTSKNIDLKPVKPVPEKKQKEEKPKKATVKKATPGSSGVSKPPTKTTSPKKKASRASEKLQEIEVEQRPQSSGSLPSVSKPGKSSRSAPAIEKLTPPPKRGRPKKRPEDRVRTYDPKVPMQCDECGKVVKGSGALRVHKQIHSNIRPHECKECGKAFRRKHHLDFHMMIHAGDKKETCSFCGKSFLIRRDLVRHERTHTGEKPFSCHLCPKSFNVKQHLTLHIRTHTGEKPYRCPICDKTFSQANSLRIHKKIHTRDRGGLSNRGNNGNRAASSSSTQQHPATQQPAATQSSTATKVIVASGSAAATPLVSSRQQQENVGYGHGVAVVTAPSSNIASSSSSSTIIIQSSSSAPESYHVPARCIEISPDTSSGSLSSSMESQSLDPVNQAWRLAMAGSNLSSPSPSTSTSVIKNTGPTLVRAYIHSNPNITQHSQQQTTTTTGAGSTFTTVIGHTPTSSSLRPSTILRHANPTPITIRHSSIPSSHVLTMRQVSPSTTVTVRHPSSPGPSGPTLRLSTQPSTISVRHVPTSGPGGGANVRYPLSRHSPIPSTIALRLPTSPQVISTPPGRLPSPPLGSSRLSSSPSMTIRHPINPPSGQGGPPDPNVTRYH